MTLPIPGADGLPPLPKPLENVEVYVRHPTHRQTTINQEYPAADVVFSAEQMEAYARAALAAVPAQPAPIQATDWVLRTGHGDYYSRTKPDQDTLHADKWIALAPVASANVAGEARPDLASLLKRLRDVERWMFDDLHSPNGPVRKQLAGCFADVERLLNPTKEPK